MQSEKCLYCLMKVDLTQEGKCNFGCGASYEQATRHRKTFGGRLPACPVNINLLLYESPSKKNS